MLPLSLLLSACGGGLLSSSCCIIQLLLNYFSIGCVGFSKLTPYEPFFKSLSGGLIALMLYKYGLTRRTVTTLLITGMLMGSKEVVRLHNDGSLKWMQGYQHEEGRGAPLQFQYKVMGIRCEGCASRVKQVVLGLPDVVNCTVNFDQKLLTVVSRTAKVNEEQLIHTIQGLDPMYKVQRVVDKEEIEPILAADGTHHTDL